MMINTVANSFTSSYCTVAILRSDVSIPQKLVMLLSHALNSVAMANFVGSELSGLLADISYLVSKIGQLLIPPTLISLCYIPCIIP